MRSLLRQCLQKDPSLRLHVIADARVEMREGIAEPSANTPAYQRILLAWVLSTGAVTLAFGLLIGPALMRYLRPPPTPAVVRSVIKVEPGHRLAGQSWDPEYEMPTRTAMAISSDGRFIVYSAIEETTGPQKDSQLYMRRTDQLEAKPIAGTEGGISPFLAPDDRWIGFWAEGKLKKVSVDGGVPVTLCDAPEVFHGITWGRTRGIILSSEGGAGLSGIPAVGGKPEVLTVPDRTKDEMSHRLPHLLPDGKGVLFTITSYDKDLQPRVALLDLKTRKWRVLMEDAADARYVRTGHLVFFRQGTLMAVRFDLDRLEIIGQPVPAIANIMQALGYIFIWFNSCAGQFSISDSGDLVYVSGGIVPDRKDSLVWVDRKGNAQPAGLPKGSFFLPLIAPDGQRIAYSSEGRESSVWVYDIKRTTVTRLTHEGSTAGGIWTPDGRRIAFSRWKSASIDIFWQPADGSAHVEQLTTCEAGEVSHNVGSWTLDGATLAFTVWGGDARPHIRLLDLHSRGIKPLLDSRSNEMLPEFSPDGRWLAYVSDEAGRNEVYVRPFPGPGPKWQVSSEGGSESLWARSGKQLFYRQGDQFWVVDVRLDAGFAPSKPRLLFEKPGYAYTSPLGGWDISPDGQRFLMVKLQEMKPQPVTEMILVQNWFEELKRLCPTGR